jgi:hypothetical protein
VGDDNISSLLLLLLLLLLEDETVKEDVLLRLRGSFKKGEEDVVMMGLLLG